MPIAIAVIDERPMKAIQRQTGFNVIVEVNIYIVVKVDELVPEDTPIEQDDHARKPDGAKTDAPQPAIGPYHRRIAIVVPCPSDGLPHNAVKR
jgi:hypothetical protein